jgi:hypothetical protein
LFDTENGAPLNQAAHLLLQQDRDSRGGQLGEERIAIQPPPPLLPAESGSGGGSASGGGGSWWGGSSKASKVGRGKAGGGKVDNRPDDFLWPEPLLEDYEEQAFENCRKNQQKNRKDRVARQEKAKAAVEKAQKAAAKAAAKAAKDAKKAGRPAPSAAELQAAGARPPAAARRSAGARIGFVNLPDHVPERGREIGGAEFETVEFEPHGRK